MSWRVPRLPASSQESGNGGVRSDKTARQRLTTAGNANEINEGHDAERAEDQRKKPTTRAARRRRRNRGGVDKQIPKVANDETFKELLALILRSVHQLQTQMRFTLGVISDSFILPSASPMVAEMKLEAEAFAREALRRRKAKEDDEDGMTDTVLALGPPTPGLFLACLEGLLKSDIGSANREVIQSLHKRLSDLQPAEIMDEVIACKLAPTANKDTARLILSIPRGTLRGQIVTALTAVAGVVHKQGGPPPGHMEEEIADWIEILRK